MTDIRRRQKQSRMREIAMLKDTNKAVDSLNSALSMLWPLVNEMAKLVAHFGIPGYSVGTFRWTENFDADWLVDNEFESAFLDDFNAGWHVDNVFSEVFNDNFDFDWRINNVFDEVFMEDFEEGDWL